MTGAGKRWPLRSAFLYAADTGIRLRLTFALACATLSALLAASVPLLLNWLVDAFARHENAGNAWVLLGAYILSLGLGRLLDLLQTHAFATAEQRLQLRLASASFRRLLHLPLRDHLAHPSGAILQLLAQGQQGLRQWLSHIVLSFVPVITQLAGIVTISASALTGGVTATLGASALIYAWVFYRGVRRLMAPARDLAQAQLAAGAMLSDRLQHVEGIKAFTAEDETERQYWRRLAEAADASTAFHSLRLGNGLAIAAVFLATLALALAQGVDAVLAGRMTPGGFVLLSAYVLQLTRPLELAGFALRDLGPATVHLSAWSDLMGREEERYGAVARERHNVPPAITFSGVTFGYAKGRPVLSDISFRVASGALVAIVGASGAGKTSLMKLLLRHEHPQSGEIRLDGRPISDMTVADVRSRMTVVGQEPCLLHGSLADNLRLGEAAADTAQMLAALGSAGLGALAAHLPEGLETHVGVRGQKFSGGERQRIAIARAFLRDRPVLLLDEPTSSLDAHTEKALLADLLKAASGRTTLLITHRLGIAACADLILVLDRGRLEASGTHADLVAANGLYARMWREQVGQEKAGA